MRPVHVSAGILAIALSVGTAMVAQQHSYSQADIDAGARIYENSCGGCHGENGDRVVGIDFVKGQFKTVRSDEDLVRVIRSGVPNTAMPPHPFNEAQAETVVAYVRSMLGGVRRAEPAAAPVPGDAVRGKAIFEGKGNCVTCHAVNEIGGRSGPDLALIGARGGRGGPARGPATLPPAPPAIGGGAPANRGAAAPVVPAPPAPAAPRGGGGRGGRGAPNPQQIQTSILDPNAEIAAAYRVYQVVTRNGTIVRGTLLNQDTFSLQMRDANDKLVGFQKQDLREFGFLPSPMPSYKDRLTSQEVADVVSYLISVRSN